jgi:WD40 repeat protein
MNTSEPTTHAIKQEIERLSNGFNSRHQIDQYLIEQGHNAADIDAAWQSLQPAKATKPKAFSVIEFVTKPLIMLVITVALGLIVLGVSLFRSDITIVAPQSAILEDTVFSPNGKFISSINTRGQLFIWQIPERNLVRTYTIRNDDYYQIGRIFWSADSRMVMATRGNTAQVFRMEDNIEIYTMLDWKGNASPAFSPNGELVVYNSTPNQLTLINIASGKEIKNIIGNWSNNYTVENLTFSPDSKFVFVELSDTIWIWDTENDQNFYLQKDLNRYMINGYNFSPDGKYFVLSMQYILNKKEDQPKIQLWDWRNKLLLRETNGGYQGTFTPIFTADNESLLFGARVPSQKRGGLDNETARLLRVNDFKFAASNIELQNRYIQDVDFSPDGKTLVLTLDNKLVLRNTADLLK